jgi:hypothetical protein
MALTLTSNIGSSDEVIRVTGTVTETPGYAFTIDNEAFRLRSFASPAPAGGDTVSPVPTDVNYWRVVRGFRGTTPASHTAGAALTTIPAIPGAGGGLPTQWVVDAKGNLRIEPDASGGDVDASLIVKGNGRPDVLMIERQLTNERTLGIDEEGFIATSGGLDIGDTAAIGFFGVVVKTTGPTGRARSSESSRPRPQWGCSPTSQERARHRRCRS